MNPRNLDYRCPITGTASPKAQQLTRHLKARLQEYFTITILEENQALAFVRISLNQDPSQDTAPCSLETFYKKLSDFHIETVLEDKTLSFYLTDQHGFEDIDFVWGKIYTILV